MLVRPSYVLGGRAMQIVRRTTEALRRYLADSRGGHDEDQPVLVDKYIAGKELEVDAICDGEERASSRASWSTWSAPASTRATRSASIRTFSVSEKVQGCHFGLYPAGWAGASASGACSTSSSSSDEDETVYVIEVNPRSSRTVPFLSKATGIPMPNIATKVMLGHSLAELGYQAGEAPRIRMPTVWRSKCPVFSFCEAPGRWMSTWGRR